MKKVIAIHRAVKNTHGAHIRGYVETTYHAIYEDSTTEKISESEFQDHFQKLGKYYKSLPETGAHHNFFGASLTEAVELANAKR